MNGEIFQNLPDFRGKAEGLAALNRRKENNIALAGQIGNPVRLFYPAGRWDIGHLAMPSVTVMAIADLVPFLFSEPRSDNTHSALIHKILQAHDGLYMTLSQIFQEPSLPVDEKEKFEKRAASRVETHIRYASADMAYETGAESRLAQVRNDSFADVVAGVFLLGGDLTTMQVGKFGEDFRVQFTVDGQSKTVIFRQAHIGADFAQEGSANYRWAQTCFDGFEEGPTALFVKSDLQRVSKHVVEAVKPDVIVGNCSVITEIEFLYRDSYHFPEQSPLDFPHPDQGWGQKTIKDLRTGYRILVYA